MHAQHAARSHALRHTYTHTMRPIQRIRPSDQCAHVLLRVRTSRPAKRVVQAHARAHALARSCPLLC
eukprot:2549906-Alexandrium_andersonii.AAC.1